jgi:hypothetical protein
MLARTRTRSLHGFLSLFGVYAAVRSAVSMRMAPSMLSGAAHMQVSPPPRVSVPAAGLGVLVARKESLMLLHKVYFGGGSVVEATGVCSHSCHAQCTQYGPRRTQVLAATAVSSLLPCSLRAHAKNVACLWDIATVPFAANAVCVADGKSPYGVT